MCDQHLLPKDLKLNSEYADNHMQVFIILRYLRAHLTSFNQETTAQLRSTWAGEREVDAWQPEQDVELKDFEIILCNTRLN
jgi:hypothetical protein